MKRNLIRTYLLVGIMSLVMVISCQQQTSKWPVTLREEEGVMVVHNPDQPYYGELAFELEENLSLGAEKDDNYLFHRVRGLAVDDENNIYVVDMGNYRIQKFDQKGKYLRTIGRKGQGPGEFNLPTTMFIDSKHNLYIRDFRKIHLFNQQGEFTGSFSLDYDLSDFAVDEDGHILANAILQPRDPALGAIVKIDPNGKVIKKIAEYTFPGIKIIVGEAATFALSCNHAYTPSLQFCSLGQNIYVYGFSSDYLIHMIDKEGNPILRIRKKDSPIPISNDEKNKIIQTSLQAFERRKISISRRTVEEILHFEENRAYFDRLLADDCQRLYVRRVKSVLDESPLCEFDVFNREGYYLYRIKLPFSPEVIRDRHLYDIFTSEETGEVKIKRYKIKNWDKIKTGI